MSVATLVQCWSQVATWAPTGVQVESINTPLLGWTCGRELDNWHNTADTDPWLSGRAHTKQISDLRALETPKLSTHTHKVTARTQQMLHKQSAGLRRGVDDSQPQAQGPGRRDCPGHNTIPHMHAVKKSL